MNDELLDTMAYAFCEEIGGAHWYPCRRSLIAALKAANDAGYVLAPKEPTEAMKLAGGMIPAAFKGTGAARGNADRVYRAMIEAAEDA